MKIYNSIQELTGRTPLVELTHLEKELGLKARLVVKVEGMNPAGSVKDRVARRMVEDAEEAGILKPGSTIIESASPWSLPPRAITSSSLCRPPCPRNASSS